MIVSGRGARTGAISALGRRPGLVIFTLALALRLAWVATLDNRLQWIDEQEFATIAEHIAAGDGYVSSSFRANPVLPYYLGAVFRVAGERYVVARVGQAVLGALTCVLLYWTAALLVGRATGILSGLILASYPSHIYLSGVFYVDCWLMLLISLSVYLAALTRRRGSRLGLALLCGVSLGLTALTRASFLILVPCVCAAWMYGGRGGWRRQALACTVLVAGCALTILPWTFRNYRVYGRPILISSGFYTMLWRGNNPLADGGAGDRHLTWYSPVWQGRLTKAPEAERRRLQVQYDDVDRSVRARERQINDWYLSTDEVLKPVALQSLRTDPERTLVLMLKRVRTLFSAFSDTETANDDTTWRSWLVAASTFYPMLMLGVIGMVLGARRRRELGLLYLVIVGGAAPYVLLTACTRFRLPLDPYLIVFSSLTLVSGARASVGTAWATSRLAAEQAAAGAGAGLAAIRDARPMPEVDPSLRSASSSGTTHA